VKNRDCRSVEGLLSFIVMWRFNVITVTENLCRFSLKGDKVAYCVENKLLETRARFDQCHTDCCVDVSAVVFTNKGLFWLILGVPDVQMNETCGTAMCNRIYREPRRNGPDFGRVLLILNYADITQHTYVQS
jgi:hypothetical protein